MQSTNCSLHAAARALLHCVRRKERHFLVSGSVYSLKGLWAWWAARSLHVTMGRVMPPTGEEGE